MRESGLPHEFVGVWERIRLTVNDIEVDGSGSAFWFQGPRHFVDVRTGGEAGPEMAFAGTTTWNPIDCTLTWHRTIDLEDPSPQDSGRVEWLDGDLLEHGTAETPHGPVNYTEVWRPTSSPRRAMVIAERVDGPGYLAWDGRFAAAVVGHDAAVAGCCLSFDEDRWSVDFAVGPDRDWLTDPDTGDVIDRFTEFGMTWDVLEDAREQ